MTMRWHRTELPAQGSGPAAVPSRLGRLCRRRSLAYAPGPSRLVLAAAACWLCLPGPTAADEPTAGAAKPPTPTTPAKNQKSNSVDQQLLKSLEQTLGSKPERAQPPPESPLLKIGDKMRSVQQRLAKTDCGPQTREEQEQIVRDLDELIKQAKKGGT